MYIPCFDETNFNTNPLTHFGNTTPRLTVEITSPSILPAQSYFPATGSSDEGLGIGCEAVGLPFVHDSAIDVAYDNSLWQAQIDDQFLRPQQFCEQKLYQTVKSEALPMQLDPLYAYVSTNSTGPANIQNQIEYQENHGLSGPTSDIQRTSTIELGPYSSAHQNAASLSSFAFPVEQKTRLTYQTQPDQTSQQDTPWSATTCFPTSMNPIAYEDQKNSYEIPTTFTKLFLQPSANIQDTYHRRLSVSSSAPSSVFSSDCQSTPYNMTPCTTPRFASSVSMDVPATPMSTSWSPVYSSYSQPGSSGLLKTPKSMRPSLRPAPYTIDAAQRQRWSSGKTMSLPSRRTQRPDFFFTLGHMGATSEQYMRGMYLDGDLISDQRTSFDQSLEIIRHGLPAISPDLQQSDEQSLTRKSEEPSTCLRRPVLAAIQPKILAEMTTLSPPKVPPLNLPEQPSQAVSPPSEDLSLANSPAATVHPVSAYDAYTPKYKRGTKGQLEGFCGLCKPGRWLNMKNSKYWYDKNYNHGINSRTRRAFDLPADMRYKTGHTDIRQGFCGVCNQWIDMDTCKKSWHHWWKHAYKCQNKIDTFDYSTELNDDLQVFRVDPAT